MTTTMQSNTYLGLQQVGDIAVSLGTSDTMFTMMHQATPGKDGHVSTKCERERASRIWKPL